MVDPARKLEAKTIAAPIGGGLGGALVPFVIWLLGVYVWDAPSDAAHAIAAAAAVPPPVSGLVVAALPALLALAAAYWAPHTHRPDLAAEVPASHLDERIATHLEQVDATLTEMQADRQDEAKRNAPIKPVPAPDMGLRIMDEAHD